MADSRKKKSLRRFAVMCQTESFFHCFFLFAVSPRTWPGGAWVPGGPRPGFCCFCVFASWSRSSSSNRAPGSLTCFTCTMGIAPGKMPLAYAEASAPDLAYGTSAHFPDLAYGTSAEGHSPGGGATSSEPLLWSFVFFARRPIGSWSCMFIIGGWEMKICTWFSNCWMLLTYSGIDLSLHSVTDLPGWSLYAAFMMVFDLRGHTYCCVAGAVV